MTTTTKSPQYKGRHVRVDTDEIRFLIHRERERTKFEAIKEAIREIGLRVPVELRDISHLPPEQRRRPDGGLYKYEAFAGEGRTMAFRELYEETKDAKWKKIDAILDDAPETEIVGRFLAENVLRKNLPWHDKARLVKTDVDAGLKVDEVARRYFITVPYAAKLMRILGDLSPRIEREASKLPLHEAESLSQLAGDAQNIVIEQMQDKKLRGQLKAVMEKARRIVEETGELSATALRQSLERVDEDLERLRKKLKLQRLHYSLGPQNLEILLRDKSFRAALDAHKVNYKRFLEITK